MNLAQVLSESFVKYSDKTAVVFEGQGYRFKEIDEEIRRRAAWFQKMGVQQGDRIALQLPKGMEFIFLHLAVLSLGAMTLPLNDDYSSDEVAYFLSDSGSSIFITNIHGFSRNRNVVNELRGMRTFVVDGLSPDGSGPLSSELKKIGAEDPRHYPAQDDDVAMICYTSGTTGKSKGAMITHRNLVTNMRALKGIWEWTDRDVLLHVLPLFHIHGLVVALHGGLNAGSTIIMHEKFDPRRTWETLEKERCTLLMAVPTIYHRLLNEWERGKADLNAMRLFISGSAPLSENLFHRFEATTGFRILERYGMTEAGMIISNPIDLPGRKPKSVGYPLPGVRVRVVSEDGEDVKPGDVGEVWIQGDNVFKGYWQRLEKTKEFFEGGWFKTGDVGYQDPVDGNRLYLVGRARELIITGGYNVYPKEIENTLEKHEAVHEAAVVGIPDEDYGEKVTAFVVLKEDHSKAKLEEMIEFCKKHMASYKCPKQIFIVDQLPRNAMGKIQKDALQTNYSKTPRR
jgi:malonyl-CoA/methylmalonyl-CoA synthetase